MRDVIENYQKTFLSLINDIRCTEFNCKSSMSFTIDGVCHYISKMHKDNKLIFIGNGGSAAIANHMAIDFWKNANVPAFSFSDSSLLTCISNDYGYEHVFEKPIEMFAKPGDILFAISSSGQSKNIINAVEMAKTKECDVITLSGFDLNNSLRQMGIYNFYVPSYAYGFVEVIHQYLCHCILDIFIQTKTNS